MIVIINYGIGNLGSVKNMLKKAGIDSLISNQTSDIAQADKLILPGVGAFDYGAVKLRNSGLETIIRDKVFLDHTPILGLCLGMQLFFSTSEEGEESGLGWIKGKVIRFDFHSMEKTHKIPHMGWNVLEINKSHPLLNGLQNDSRFYFVHSYHVTCDDVSNIVASTNYGYKFPSVVAHDNIMGTQFHPEKSHKFGMKLLQNFSDFS